MTSSGFSTPPDDAASQVHGRFETLVNQRRADLPSRRRFESQAEAPMACSSYNEGLWNPARLHRGLGYRFSMVYVVTRETVTPTQSAGLQTVHENGATPEACRLCFG